jgi:hypothetical protein
VDRLRILDEFRPFDIFVHTYYPAGTGQSPKEHTTQLWVWELLRPSGSSTGFSWKSVCAGYVCPGPGALEGRHLIITDHGKPTWLLGATVYRRYKKVHPYTTTPEFGNDEEAGTFKGMDALYWSRNMAKMCKEG